MKRLLTCLAPLALGTAACAGNPHFGFTDTGAQRDGSLDATADARETAVPVDAPARDVNLDPDAACVATNAAAQVTRSPVDIIWVVDNSSSMRPAIEQLTAGLNDFASLIGTRGLDYRVIMLSLKSATNPVTRNGDRRYGVCIPRPLAGDDRCGDGERFFHASVDIKSTQPLEQLLGTLGQTAGYMPSDDRGGDPWRMHLRPDASKTIVLVTDDNSRFSADQFEHFRGGTNPATSTARLPGGLLEPAWSGLFDDYTFSAIYGYGSETDPNARCTFSDGTMSASGGPVYTTLVRRTGGVRASLCEGAPAWRPFFESVATAVVRTSRIDCDVAIPRPPDMSAIDPALVNVTLTGESSVRLGKVGSAAACSDRGGWYYDNELNPTRITLCPVSCERAQELLRSSTSGGTPAGVQVQFGCQSVPG